ncbi:MAG: hypothetical protein HY787_05055 [Deltaproteobacteria bacterium]|nr:hypothetical protein [Deltaproteobacteria bacterium]
MKNIGKPGTGWDPLMVYGNSLLQDKVLFATDDLIPWQRCIDELKALPLKEEVKKKWLGGNAARLLGLSSEETPIERAEAMAHLDFAIAEFQEMRMQPSLERAMRQ